MGTTIPIVEVAADVSPLHTSRKCPVCIQILLLIKSPVLTNCILNWLFTRLKNKITYRMIVISHMFFLFRCYCIIVYLSFTCWCVLGWTNLAFQMGDRSKKTMRFKAKHSIELEGMVSGGATCTSPDRWVSNRRLLRKPKKNWKVTLYLNHFESIHFRKTFRNDSIVKRLDFQYQTACFGGWMWVVNMF